MISAVFGPGGRSLSCIGSARRYWKPALRCRGYVATSETAVLSVHRMTVRILQRRMPVRRQIEREHAGAKHGDAAVETVVTGVAELEPVDPFQHQPSAAAAQQPERGQCHRI